MHKSVTSLRKNLLGIFIIIISSLFTAIGQYFWKLSYSTSLKYIFMGFICYGLGAVLMILAFRLGSLSFIHPMLGFGYLFAFVIGNAYLNELIDKRKVAGLIFIILGVMSLGIGDE
jgi:drug/metabolite transporter (DMT)-like permease